MADPTRPRTGPRGPHTSGEPSVERIIPCCVEKGPSPSGDMVATPHVVMDTDNYRRARKNPQTWQSVLRVESASQPASQIFLSPFWEDLNERTASVSAKRTDTAIAQQEVLALVRHHTTVWDRTQKFVHHRPTPHAGWSSRCSGPSAKVPQTARNICSGGQTTVPIVFPLHLVIHAGSLPIGMDGVEKRELASNSTKWRRRWTQSTSRTLNPGLIQSDRRLSLRYDGKSRGDENVGDYRLHCGGASPLVISDTVLRRRSTWPPIVSRRPSTRSVGASPPRLSTRGAKRLPLL